jgi:hypothetical protein
MRLGFARYRFNAPVAEERARHMRAIVGVVRHGADAAMGTTAEVFAESARVPWTLQDFFWEGVAFGSAADHSFSLRGGNPDQRRHTDLHRLMHYTGYGLWIGMARAYHVPGFAAHPEHWRSVEDFAKYGPLLAGGVSFGVVCASRKFGRRTLPSLALPDLPGWAEAAVHGCGRALWFLYPADVERLERIVDEHPEQREGLLEGIGIANGFTQLHDPAAIDAVIRRFSAWNRSHVIGGTVVALAETVDEDAVDTHLLPRLTPELQHALHAFRAARARITAADDHYYLAYTAVARAIALKTEAA